MQKKIDYVILICTCLLIVIGLFMVYSASNIVASYKYNDQFYFLKRQLIFAIIGIVLMIIVTKINLSVIYKKTTLFFIISLALIILVLIPGVGLVRGGARSWIGFKSLSIQPSEFIKVSLILLLSKYLSKHNSDCLRLKNFLILLIFIFLIFGLIMLQPDFGTGIVILLSASLLLFVSGAPLKYFFNMSLIFVILAVGLVISAPYRLTRIMSFFDPWSDPLGSGFQSIQSLFAIAPSGIFGLGFNNSMQKHFFLPEPQNDFIFAIICEELGLIGSSLVLMLFLIIIIRTLKNALNTNNLYCKYLGIGTSAVLFIQVFINIGVVIGLLPVTGITLPIISYGGTSLVLTLILIGINLNASRFREFT